MVATRRSHSLDTKEEPVSTRQPNDHPRNVSSRSSRSKAKSTHNVDNGWEDDEHYSAHIRGGSPSASNSRRSRRSGRFMDDQFEWESYGRSKKLRRHSREVVSGHEEAIRGGLRRSARHRSSNFISLDEDYIQMAKRDHVSSQDFQDDVPSKKVERKKELQGLLAAQGKDIADAELYNEPDIYSSVKSRVRNSTKNKLYEEYYTADSSKKKQEEEEGETEEETEEDEEEDEHTNEEQDSEEEEEEVEDEGHPYKLRKVREAPKRYMIVRDVRTRRPRTLFEELPCSPARRRSTRRSRGSGHNNPYHTRRRRARTQGNSSTSDDDSSSDDERKFRKRQKKSMARARTECLPINLTATELGKHSFARERKQIGQSLADIDPMALDASVTFSSVGGHNKHIRALKEMVVFPLLYPEVFERFSITPPRGCLFYGPPGTGKTLMARALANECSTEGKKVSFFMKKGADCLSKWIGESERQLRVLFDQAYQMRPSIIFFDEIDGLAPVRSSRQDQIHSSIVSTLLALMDGLDSRGEIIVIGATNRIDSIDPALRRPGRFDREFLFPLPDKQAREAIVRIHTKAWNPQLKPSFIEYLATKTVGYCGADIKALCTEAALIALRRRYPQIYESREKLQLDVSTISIQASDFNMGIKNIIPTAQRSASNPGRALSPTIKPLMQGYLEVLVTQLATLFPVLKRKSKLMLAVKNTEDRNDGSGATLVDDPDSDIDVAGPSGGIYVGEEDPNERINSMLHFFSGNNNGIVQTGYANLLQKLTNEEHSLATVHRPRFIICGNTSSGHSTHLAPALLHDFEGVPVHCLDLPALYGISVRTPEESCAQVFREARRLTPSVIYLPNASQWWTVASPTVQATLQSLLQDIPPNSPVLFLATANCSYRQLPREFARFFHSDFDEVYEAKVNFTSEQRKEFFAPIFLIHAITPPPQNKKKNLHKEVLLKAPVPEPAPLTEAEVEKLEKEEESTVRNLRLFLRDLLMRLERDRRFKIFSKPVDFEEVPDYIEVIKNPMDFSTMQMKIDQHKYHTVGTFLADVDLICNNALEYNPDRRPEDKLIRHRACAMRDLAHAIVDTDLEPEFEKLCCEIVESRKRRGVSANKYAPKYYPVLPKHLMVHPQTGEIVPKPDTEKPVNHDKKEDQVVEDGAKTPWKQQPPKKTPTSKKRKRSPWCRGVLRKRKRVVKIESENGGENETEAPQQEQHKQDDDVVQINGDTEVELSEDNIENSHANISSVHFDDDVIADAPQNTIVADGNMTLPNLFQNGYGLNEEVPEDEIGLNNTSSRENSFAVNGEMLDEANKEPSADAGDGNDKENEVTENSTDDVILDDITPESPPRKMMLRSRNRSTSESNHVEKIEDTPPTPPPPFIIDHKAMVRLLEKVTETTDSYTLDELERAHTILSRCVEKYKMVHDRSALTQDLESTIDSLNGHTIFETPTGQV